MRFLLTMVAAVVVLVTGAQVQAQVMQPTAGANPTTSDRSQPEAKQADYRSILVSLCDPAKLATLGDRGANPRLKKIVYWLEYARTAGNDPAQVIDEVLRQNRYGAGHATLVKTNLLRNLKIGDELGFFTAENLERLRRGMAPRVMAGTYTGDEGEVDHIIPFAIAPEIGNDLANLELMPGILNRKKSAKVGQRQKALANDLHTAGVISDQVLNRILAVASASGPSLDAGSLIANGAPVSSRAISPPASASSKVIVVPTSSATVHSITTASSAIVWVDTESGIYHMPGTKWYGHTTQGKYISEDEAIREGDRRSRNGE